MSEFPLVFNGRTNKMIGDIHADRLLELAAILKSPEKVKNSSDSLTSIRKIMESMFHHLAAKGVIPEAIIGSKGWINNSSKFLSGKHPEFLIHEDLIHPLIADTIFRLLLVTQDGSHEEGELRLKVSTFCAESGTDFTLRSAIYQLFEVLVWMGEFVARTEDLSKHGAFWTQSPTQQESEQNGPWLRGRVVNFQSDKGFGFFRSDDGTVSCIVPPEVCYMNKLMGSELVIAILQDYIDEKRGRSSKVSMLKIIKA